MGDIDIEKAINTLKNASKHMIIWLQDADDKKKYYEIKPDSEFGYYQINYILKERK
jgi:hypothetical protein